MEYTSLISPLLLIGISLGIGAFFGSLWMFWVMYKNTKSLENELEVKNEQLERYVDKFERLYDEDITEYDLPDEQIINNLK